MRDFYFRTIQISEFDKILKEFKNSIDFKKYTEPFSYIEIDKFKSCKTFLSWCKHTQLEIKKIAVIVSSIKSNSALPHVDSQTNCLALNFPIQNCKDAFTEFYNIPEKYIEITKENNGVQSKSIVSNSFGDCVTKYELLLPTLVNTHKPHKIVCNSDLTRISLSIRFINDPWHLINEENTVFTD